MTNKYQGTFGYPLEHTKGKVRPAMAAWIEEFIRRSPFWLLATRVDRQSQFGMMEYSLQSDNTCAA